MLFEESAFWVEKGRKSTCHTWMMMFGKQLNRAENGTERKKKQSNEIGKCGRRRSEILYWHWWVLRINVGFLSLSQSPSRSHFVPFASFFLSHFFFRSKNLKKPFLSTLKISTTMHTNLLLNWKHRVAGNSRTAPINKPNETDGASELTNPFLMQFIYTSSVLRMLMLLLLLLLPLLLFFTLGCYSYLLVVAGSL